LERPRGRRVDTESGSPHFSPERMGRTGLFRYRQSGVGAVQCRSPARRQIQKRQRTAAVHDAVANQAKTGASPRGGVPHEVVYLALRGTVGRSATDSTLHRVTVLGEGIHVCHGDAFDGMASEERRCFGVRAAERSADAALVLPEEANPLTPIRIPCSSTASHEEPRNPQRAHLRPLNEWQCCAPPRVTGRHPTYVR
jgi:hypothetical protein